MEITAYNELKDTRDAARKDARNLKVTVSHLKYALINAEASDQVTAAAIKELRETTKVRMGEAIARRDELTAQVTAARDEYRAENVNKILAGTTVTITPVEDDEDDEDVDDSHEDGYYDGDDW